MTALSQPCPLSRLPDFAHLPLQHSVCETTALDSLALLLLRTRSPRPFLDLRHLFHSLSLTFLFLKLYTLPSQKKPSIVDVFNGFDDNVGLNRNILGITYDERHSKPRPNKKRNNIRQNKNKAPLQPALSQKQAPSSSAFLANAFEKYDLRLKLAILTYPAPVFYLKSFFVEESSEADSALLGTESSQFFCFQISAKDQLLGHESPRQQTV